MSSTDLLAIVRSYLVRALRDVPGMKVLLLDAETMRTVSTALSQSDILEQEVYLVERIDAEDKREHLAHLNAVVFLRPTRENIARLRRELKAPRFGTYHIHCTNRIEDMRLQDLAEGDTQERVACVHELFGDFIALESHHISVPLPRPHLALTPMSWDFGASTEMITRLTEALASIVLCLRRRFSVRYQRGSEGAQRLAQALHHLTAVEQRELFDFGSRGGELAPPLLLILDRRDDPVTPLLSQWTYQAMVHEMLGSRDNRVVLPAHVSMQRPELAEAVLTAHQDPFYAKNMYANFGDVGMAVKTLVDDAVSAEGRGARDFQSLDDMSSFVENLPEMTHQQGITARHVALMTELSHGAERRQLMKLSSLEQDIVCAPTSNVSGHYEAVAEVVRSVIVTKQDKVRLITLFAVRYEREGRAQISSLMSAAAEGGGVDPGMLSAMRALLKYCGGEQRVSDLFSERSFSSRFATLAKQHLKGVENVYTQHVPQLVSILERVAKGKLVEADYPKVEGGGGGPTSSGSTTTTTTTTGVPSSSTTTSSSSSSAMFSSDSQKPPRLVVVFIVGGTTYEEAKSVAELNAMADRGEGWSAGMKFLLGGTSGPHSSTTFLEDWAEVALMERYSAQRGHQDGAVLR